MAASIKQLRTRIAALQRERETINAQERSREEVRAAVLQYAERLDAEFADRARYVLRRVAAGGRLSGMFNAALADFGADAAMPLVATLGAATVADAMLRHLESAVPAGLDAEARAARLSDIATELDALEIEEEALIEASEATAAPILRRPDCRPEIVLGMVAR